MKRILLGLVPALLLASCGAPTETSSQTASLDETLPEGEATPEPAPELTPEPTVLPRKTMNERVLAAVADIGKNDAGLGYSLESNAQHTRSIFYAGEKVFSVGSRKSQCVGMTFQVLTQALNDYYKETSDARAWNMPAAWLKWSPFKECWYINGDCTSAGYAMNKFGIGSEFTDLSKLKAGDFLQYWRTSGSGHSVVFLNFINGDDKIVSEYPRDMIGFEYFSSQGSTNGVARMRAYFDGSCRKEHANSDCRIIRTSVAAGRLSEPSDFRVNRQFTFSLPVTPYNSSRLFR